ncbi:MAG: hypothetical protein IJ666_02705 [Ruminococcus sp.]|nr:hypothetical protein [Ruminococcus sp.]
MIIPNEIKNTDNPEELADLIDRLMSQGSGHVNIQSGGGGFRVNTVRSTDCSGTKGACCQPTENAVDDDED